MGEDMMRRVREAWDELSWLREKRRCCKNVAFGTGHSGDVRNNLTRQLLKSIIGRYMYLQQGESAAREPNILLGIDARALEEFLISGVTIQRVMRYSGEVKVENVSPELVAFEQFKHADGSDCRYFAMLHDMERGEMLRRFSGGDASKTSELLDLFSHVRSGGCGIPCRGDSRDFDTPLRRDCIRVAEVWERRADVVLLCHDTMRGEYGEVVWSDANVALLRGENRRRKEIGRDEIRVIADVRDVWVERWCTTTGAILLESVHRDRSEAFPFVMSFYPFIDGEVHSLVEDVMPQQELVDRMVSLLDTVIANSAKGVLLYPTDQLPEGFTWRDIRRIWSDAGGVLPYRRTSRTMMPQQISTSGWATGASDMLRLQMEMFEQVAGVSGTLRGRDSGSVRGAEALATHTENATVGMMDLLASFQGFVKRRDALIERTINLKEGETRE